MALKKAWVQIWKNAKFGKLTPIDTIISPSWLEVEKAIIFLISFWVRADMAAKAEEIAPRHRQVVKANWFWAMRG